MIYPAESIQHVLAQSAQALISELWLEALSQQLDYPRTDGTPRTLWTYWNASIPQPNPTTAPFWLFACESLSHPDSHPDNADGFTFVPPQSLPLHLENIEDAGCDRFIHPGYAAIAHTQRQAVNPKMRHLMREIGFDATTPVARYEDSRLIITARPVSDRDVLPPVQSIIESTWRARRELAEHFLTPPLTPTCPMRIYGPVGMHIKQWSYWGLRLRGKYPGHLREWLQGDGVLVGRTIVRRVAPHFTMPIWFGWDWVNNASLFQWCESYVAHRPAALRALRDPASYHADSEWDHSNELRTLGRASSQPSTKQFSTTTKRIDRNLRASELNAAVKHLEATGIFPALIPHEPDH